MAKLPALVTALAEVDGRERATVDHVARLIREAGYIPTTKRGSGAADMTPREAVNLFLAMNGADAPKEGPLAIDRFRSLRLQYSEPREPPALEPFRSIARTETFGEALELLLDGMPTIIAAAFNFIDQGYSEGNESGRELFKKQLLTSRWSTPFMLSVSLERYAAEVICKTWVGTDVQDAHWRTEFFAKYLVDADRFMEGFYGGGGRDRRVSVEVTGQTFWALWRALNGEEGE